MIRNDTFNVNNIVPPNSDWFDVIPNIVTKPLISVTSLYFLRNYYNILIKFNWLL